LPEAARNSQKQPETERQANFLVFLNLPERFPYFSNADIFPAKEALTIQHLKNRSE
jgi:hypothetical protein